MKIPSRMVLLGCLAVTAMAQVKQMGGWCAAHGTWSGSGNCPVCARGGEGPRPEAPRGPSKAQMEAQAARERRAKANEFNNAGVAAWNRGEWGIAGEQFRQAYAWNPDSKQILTNLANARFKQGLVAWEAGEWEYSATCFQSAAMYVPDSAEFQRHFAMARKKTTELREQELAQREDARIYALAHTQAMAGIAASGKGDWIQAEALFRAAMGLYPAEPSFLKNLAWTITKQGDQAWKQGDTSAAIASWQRALATDPQNAYAAKMVRLGREHLQIQAQERVVVADVQGEIKRIAEDVKAKKPAAGLDFQDYAVASQGGPLGGRPDVKVALTPKPKSKPGTRTKAGDQLKSAAAQATVGEDGRVTFDIGGAPSAGSLIPHTVGGGPRPLDLATFSERARKDPQLMTMVQDLAELQVKRRQLESEREALVSQRNRDKDPAKVQALSDQVGQKEKEYQTNLKAIFDQTEQVEKRHRMVDDEEQPPPASKVTKATKATKDKP